MFGGAAVPAIVDLGEVILGLCTASQAQQVERHWRSAPTNPEHSSDGLVLAKRFVGPPLSRMVTREGGITDNCTRLLFFGLAAERAGNQVAEELVKRCMALSLS